MSCLRWIAMAFAASALMACSHKKEYEAASSAYQTSLGDIASYAPLLDESTYSGVSAPVVRAARDQAAKKICRAARDRVMTAHPATSVEKRIVAVLEAEEQACCDADAANACADAVKSATSTLAQLDADAVKAGLPAGSLAPTAGEPKVHAEVDAIRAATKSSSEEARLRQVWVDPSATRAALELACAAARASDPKKTEYLSKCGDAVECVTQARASETSDWCSALSDYERLEDDDFDAANTPAVHTKLCKEAQRTESTPPPASMSAKRELIRTKHCP